MTSELLSSIPESPGLPGSREAIASAVGFAVSELGPDQVVLFGSGARGEMDGRSDIDLLLIRPFPAGSDPPGGLAPFDGADWPCGDIPVHVILTDRERAESERRCVGDVRQRALDEGRTLYLRPGARPVGTRYGPPEVTAMAAAPRRELDFSAGAARYLRKARSQLDWCRHARAGGGDAIFEDGSVEAAFGCFARAAECSLKAVCLAVGVNPPAGSRVGHNLGHIMGVIERASPSVGKELRGFGLTPGLLRRLGDFLGRGAYDDPGIELGREALDSFAEPVGKLFERASEAVREMPGRGVSGGPRRPLKSAATVSAERSGRGGPGSRSR